MRCLHTCEGEGSIRACSCSRFCYTCTLQCSGVGTTCASTHENKCLIVLDSRKQPTAAVRCGPALANADSATQAFSAHAIADRPRSVHLLSATPQPVTGGHESLTLSHACLLSSVGPTLSCSCPAGRLAFLRASLCAFLCRSASHCVALCLTVPVSKRGRAGSGREPRGGVVLLDGTAAIP